MSSKVFRYLIIRELVGDLMSVYSDGYIRANSLDEAKAKVRELAIHDMGEYRPADVRFTVVEFEGFEQCGTSADVD
jgi:predicted secreted Zn-dependent protease